ncbi:MAG TPA: hypothetical protein VH165_02755 [Kofleriaceae bacterium]|jgi:hypothetical protein|nr:hypothetical protein [Kofleriaceae bacterium]
MAESEPRGIVDLPGAGVPADHGLASLGLMMQLAGRITAALAALAIVVGMQQSAIDRAILPWLVMLGIGAIGRSILHQIAGRDLVYGRRTADGRAANPFAATRLYVLFGIGHAIVIGAMMPELGMTRPTAVGVMIALAVWPIALAVILQTLGRTPGKTSSRTPSRTPEHSQAGPRLDPALPLGEDRGLEGASIVMTVLGAAGLVSAAALLLLIGALRHYHLRPDSTVILGAVFTVLALRAVMQLRAGLAGLGAASFDLLAERTARYTRFGMLSALGLGMLTAPLLMAQLFVPAALMCAAIVTWLAMAWPLTIRRFVDHRRCTEVILGPQVIHRRAPDAGLTALGWLLVGHAALIGLGLGLAAQAEPLHLGRAITALVALCASALGRTADEHVLAGAVVALELFAAVAVLRMSDHRRLIATTYAVVAGAVTLALSWPLVRSFQVDPGNLRTVLRLLPAGLQLVLPVATLALVHRVVQPTAQARYRAGP